MKENYITQILPEFNRINIESSMLVLIIDNILRGYTERDLEYAKYINQAGLISGSTLIG